MGFAKRIVLFLLLNFLVIAMVSIVLNLLNVRPYLNQYGLDYKSLLIFCLVWGMSGAFISLALSRKMAKWTMGVQIIDPSTHVPLESKLVKMVYSLARSAGLETMPQVGIFSSNEPNAFATGPTKSRSLVAVSTGLLARMGDEDLKGVLGHEISHVANGDMVTMTLLQGVVNAFVMFLARALAYVISGMGRNRSESSNRNSGTFMILTYLFEVVFMVFGSLLICAFSRYREFRADARGARLAGRQSMIGALQTLMTLQQIKDPKTDTPAMAAMKISHPTKKGLIRFFATHPALEERIERLKSGNY
jgi:heat shock protein HtpX